MPGVILHWKHANYLHVQQRARVPTGLEPVRWEFGVQWCIVRHYLHLQRSVRPWVFLQPFYGNVRTPSSEWGGLQFTQCLPKRNLQ